MPKVKHVTLIKWNFLNREHGMKGSAVTNINNPSRTDLSPPQFLRIDQYHDFRRKPSEKSVAREDGLVEKKMKPVSPWSNLFALPFLNTKEPQAKQQRDGHNTRAFDIPLMCFIFIFLIVLLGTAGYGAMKLMDRQSITLRINPDENPRTSFNLVKGSSETLDLKRVAEDPGTSSSGPFILSIPKVFLNQTRIASCSGYVYSRKFAYLPLDFAEGGSVPIVKQMLTVRLNVLDDALHHLAQKEQKLTWNILKKLNPGDYHCCCSIKLLELEALTCRAGSTLGEEYPHENIEKAFQLSEGSGASLDPKRFSEVFLHYNAFVDCRIETIEWASGTPELDKRGNNIYTFVIQAQFIYPYRHVNYSLSKNIDMSLGDCALIHQ